MYDYGSPEKNKEHYGNVSVMITLSWQHIFCYFVSSRLDQFLLILRSSSLFGPCHCCLAKILILSAWHSQAVCKHNVRLKCFHNFIFNKVYLP